VNYRDACKRLEQTVLVVLPDVLFIIAYHLENKPSIIIVVIKICVNAIEEQKLSVL
jgi:hypothetical protein